MAKPKDITGLRSGKLVALYSLGKLGHPMYVWRCRCDCGNLADIQIANLTTGHTTSCGCARANGKIKHGRTYSREWRIWCGMKTRCLNSRSKSYADYGARGITVCDRWRDSFEAFFSDMGLSPPGTSIERDDTNGNYGPDNCRWATREEQNRNTRKNVYLEHEGRRMTLAEWGRETGINPGTLGLRVRAGWTHSRALTTPVVVAVHWR